VRFIAAADPVVQVRETAAKKAGYLTFRFFALSICDQAFSIPDRLWITHGFGYTLLPSSCLSVVIGARGSGIGDVHLAVLPRATGGGALAATIQYLDPAAAGH
jgi:hypothetical protein